MIHVAKSSRLALTTVTMPTLALQPTEVQTVYLCQ